MSNHYNLDEVPCPRCGGAGGWSDEDDDYAWIDVYDNWNICPRCQGAGTILVKIRKEKVEDER